MPIVVRFCLCVQWQKNVKKVVGGLLSGLHSFHEVLEIGGQETETETLAHTHTTPADPNKWQPINVSDFLAKREAAGGDAVFGHLEEHVARTGDDDVLAQASDTSSDVDDDDDGDDGGLGFFDDGNVDGGAGIFDDGGLGLLDDDDDGDILIESGMLTGRVNWERVHANPRMAPDTPHTHSNMHTLTRTHARHLR